PCCCPFTPSLLSATDSTALLFPCSFFSILRPPPPSTLFPYTTLFRSLAIRADATAEVRSFFIIVIVVSPLLSCVGSGCCCSYYRSEEHTSELQSRENLVCRLLLEKKKNIIGLSV